VIDGAGRFACGPADQGGDTRHNVARGGSTGRADARAGKCCATGSEPGRPATAALWFSPASPASARARCSTGRERRRPAPECWPSPAVERQLRSQRRDPAGRLTLVAGS